MELRAFIKPDPDELRLTSLLNIECNNVSSLGTAGEIGVYSSGLFADRANAYSSISGAKHNFWPEGLLGIPQRQGPAEPGTLGASPLNPSQYVKGLAPEMLPWQQRYG